MENEHEMPRLGITICIEPPNDNNKDQGPSSSGSIFECVCFSIKISCQYLIFIACRQFPANHQPLLYDGYPQLSLPQDIPRIDTSYEDLHNSPNGFWDAQSPALSDSGWSPAFESSLVVDHFGEGKLILPPNLGHHVYAEL
jgi:hypothetical protein